MWRPLDCSLLSEWSWLPRGEGQREGLRSRLIPTTSQLAPSSLIHSLLWLPGCNILWAPPASPVAPSLPPLLVPPGPLHVGVLWDTVRRASSRFCWQALPSSVILPSLRLQMCPEADTPRSSSSGFTSALQARVATCPCRGKPHPTCCVCPVLATVGGLSSLCSPLEGKLHREVFLFTLVAAAPGGGVC